MEIKHEYFLRVGNNKDNYEQKIPTWEDIEQKYINITGKSPYQENDKVLINDFVNWLFTVSITGNRITQKNLKYWLKGEIKKNE